MSKISKADQYLNDARNSFYVDNPVSKNAEKEYEKQRLALKSQLQKELIDRKKYNDDLIALENEYAIKRAKIQQNALKSLSLNQLKEYRKLEKESLEYVLNSDFKISKEKRKHYEEQLKAAQQYEMNINKVISDAELGVLTSSQRKKAMQERAKEHISYLNNLEQQLNAATKSAKDSGLDDQTVNAIRQEYLNKINAYKLENGISESQLQIEKQEADKYDKQNNVLKALDKIHTVASKISDVLSTEIENAINYTAENSGKTDARLQGLDETFADYANSMQASVGLNAYVSQRKLMDNIVKFTDAGITYNYEQRALIDTLSEKMVTTFDAMDSTLTRLIRIQQADLTMSQLGAEATLTQFLNQKFGNTEYLGTSGGSGLYDSVYAALIDASATMNKDAATSYAFNAQKWLGSMYSVGVSDSAIQSIAQGLGYIATGDVTSLSSNSALQTLFAMAAKNAGLSYASMLTNGATSDEINSLLKSMVEYLQDISTNTGNQVTRNAFAQLLNISMADLQAIRNLNSTDISDIYSTNVNYASSVQEANNQLAQVINRTVFSEKVNNLMSNAQFNIGMDIANSPVSLITWQTSKLLSQINDAIGLEGKFGALISGIATAASLLSVVTAGLQENGWVSDLLGGSFDLTFGKSFLENSAGFSWDEVTSRGTLLTTSYSGSGQSFSAYMGQADSIVKANTLSASESNVSTIDSKYSSELTKSADDIYQELFINQISPIRIKLADIEMTALAQLRVDELHDIHEAFKSPIAVVESSTGSVFDGAEESGQDIIDTVQTVRNGIYSGKLGG